MRVNQVEDDRSTRAYELLERARDFLKNGHPHQAAMLLSEAKLIEPDKGSIREALGRALYLAGRTARARREFAKAVQIDPVNDYAMRPSEEYRQALARIAG